MTSPPTLFETFNARSLEPHEVARTFVPPEHYTRLVRRCHTLLVGPRGSGKTTLLKMLQGAALEAWRRPEGTKFRESVDFTGVFIPADRSWSAQIDSVGEALSDEHRRLLGIATFTTHVLRAVVMAISYRVHPPDDPTLTPHRRVKLGRMDEAAFVRELADAWNASLAVPSLLSLQHTLTARLSSIQQIHSTERTRGPEGRNERLAQMSFLHLDFLAGVSVAAALFDSFDSHQGKWALLFDELELAPPWIRESLIGSLRSTDDRLIFKLSLSPFSADVNRLNEVLAPRPGQDFDPIPLWYANKEQGYAFCDKLFRSILRARGIRGTSPIDLLGRSEFETPVKEFQKTTTAYQPRSRLQKRFADLAAVDKTFRRYLAEHSIDLDRLHELGGDQRAAEIRKITGLVAVRYAFRAADSHTGQGGRPVRQERSRKNPTLYRGATALYAMVEGNPRWLIGIVSSILDAEQAKERPVDPAIQAHEVMRAANRFRAFLKTIPCPAIAGQSAHRGVLSVLDPIGQYFHDRVVTDTFNPDAPGTFTVDSTATADLLRALSDALNAGAIIYVPFGTEPVVLDSLRGKRFRIAYLLAAHYGLPLHLGRAVSLRTIFTSTGKPIRKHARASETQQRTLF